MTNDTPISRREFVATSTVAAAATPQPCALATQRATLAQVLNEGVDMPEADVGVVISGTGTVREHVQRLGRLLRPGDEKLAVLYELVTTNTAEEKTSVRRREHDAF